jgi:hypothetical protein
MQRYTLQHFYLSFMLAKQSIRFSSYCTVTDDDGLVVRLGFHDEQHYFFFLLSQYNAGAHNTHAHTFTLMNTRTQTLPL